MTYRDDTPDHGRRRMLTGLALGGAAVVGGVAGGVTSAVASGGGFRRETLTVDVACLGNKWRQGSPDAADGPDDFRQAFSVEGLIYPAGTIPGDGFVPTVDGTIGQWMCRGWVMIDRDRPEPHAMSVQEYLFGLIGPDALFPGDAMTSSGLEGTETDQISKRSVIGGTGRYLAAAGQVSQRHNGTNTTVFFGSSDPAPNFIFDFDLLIPDV